MSKKIDNREIEARSPPSTLIPDSLSKKKSFSSSLLEKFQFLTRAFSVLLRFLPAAMEKYAKKVFSVALLSITSIIVCHAASVGDFCVQGGVPGKITLDAKCPYFEALGEDEQRDHLMQGHGFVGINVRICCKGFGTSSVRTGDEEYNPTVPTTTLRPTRTTRPDIFATRRPIATDGGIEYLCKTIGPYPGILVFDRIIGGVLAATGEFPHFAALAYRNKETGTVSFNCGGALISHRHVLTAAHCFKTKDSLVYVRLGTVRIL